MILSFSEDEFVGRVLDGSKLHTMREDKHNRYKVGQTLQLWRGNPRNTNAKTKPYQFAEGKVLDISRIKYVPGKGFFMIEKTELSKDVYLLDGKMGDMVYCAGYLTRQLAFNDGFDSAKEMADWFNNETFEGKLIWIEVVKQLV